MVLLLMLFLPVLFDSNVQMCNLVIQLLFELFCNNVESGYRWFVRLERTVVSCVCDWPWPRRPCRRPGGRARKEQTPAGGDGGHAARHTEHVNSRHSPPRSPHSPRVTLSLAPTTSLLACNRIVHGVPQKFYLIDLFPNLFLQRDLVSRAGA